MAEFLVKCRQVLLLLMFVWMLGGRGKGKGKGNGKGKVHPVTGHEGLEME